MAEETNDQDRTEAPTQRRLQKAREEGHVPISHELHLFVGLAAVTLVLVWSVKGIAGALARRLETFLTRADNPALAGPQGLHLAWTAMLHAIGPFVLAALASGVAASLLQTGFLLRPDALAVDLSRISPAAGLRRLFGRDGLAEALKSIAKIAVMAFALWHAVRSELPVLMQAVHWAPATVLSRTMSLVLHMLFVVLALQAAITTLDLLWVRLRHARQLRMSKMDVQEEQRESEGDPKIKARLRQIRVQRARRRMLAAVPKATVVITNPTHYAVALTYDRAKNAAPRVVAKGVDSLAARIREVAQAHRVPLVANPPLAHALYRVDLDTEIPAHHYQAVAEIIAYVWRLGQRVRPVRPAA
jgi:flagellar biosynthetic protein FlhB